MDDEMKCKACKRGDHSHHQRALGGICIGCTCAHRPQVVVLEMIDKLCRNEIVRRVNAHDALVAALEKAEEWMSSGDAIPVDGWGIRNKSADAEREAITVEARAALLAARSP